MTRGFATAGTPDEFTQAADSLGQIAASRPNINHMKDYLLKMA